MLLDKQRYQPLLWWVTTAALVRAYTLLCCICRQAKAHYEGELKLRGMNNDHVGAMEWEWVWSMLQSKQGSSAGIAQEEVLAKAQQQVHMHFWAAVLWDLC